MRPFEYASPRTEAEAVELLGDHGGDTAVLAGGTDLLNLMRRDLLAPKRVVDLKTVPSLQGVTVADDGGLWIGSLTTLEDLLEDARIADHQSLLDVVRGIRSIQMQSMGTIGGDLCHLPNCWYYRNGHGLLARENGKSLVEAGENQFHAILGNHGPAKFVNASRFAPAFIAWGAKVRVIGPGPEDQELLPLEYFYVTPRTERQGVTVLKPGQLISHVWIPDSGRQQSATYEVLQSRGLDWPLAAASACVELEDGMVRSARIVLGHVAPIPWICHEAASAIIGRPMNEETAALAGQKAVAGATPLSKNGYKVQLAATSVKRALLRAAGLPEGGL